MQANTVFEHTTITKKPGDHGSEVGFTEKGAKGAVHGIVQHDSGLFRGGRMGGGIPGFGFAGVLLFVVDLLVFPIVFGGVDPGDAVFGDEADVGHAVLVVAEEQDKKVTGAGEFV